MASRLPSNPSIDHLRAEARKLQRADRTPLHQAQFAVARDYGFSSWPRLVHYLRDARRAQRRSRRARTRTPWIPRTGSARGHRCTTTRPTHHRAGTQPQPCWPPNPTWSTGTSGPPHRPPTPVALARHLTSRPALANHRRAVRLGTADVPAPIRGFRWAATASEVLDVRRTCCSTRAPTPTAGYLWCGLSTTLHGADRACSARENRARGASPGIRSPPNWPRCC